MGDAVFAIERSAPGLQGSWNWKALATVVVQAVSAEATVMSTGFPMLISVPAGVPAGQAGAVAPLSGTVTTTEPDETELIGAGRVPNVTLVMLPRFVPVIVTTVPGRPEAGLIAVMTGLVCAIW